MAAGNRGPEGERRAGAHFAAPADAEAALAAPAECASVEVGRPGDAIARTGVLTIVAGLLLLRVAHHSRARRSTSA